MPSKKNKKKKKDASSGNLVAVAPSVLCRPKESSLPKMEVSPVKMPVGFNLDDFLFSKLYKCVNVEGRRTINEVLQVIFHRRTEADASSYTVHQFLMEMNLSRNKMSSIISKLDKKLLEEKLVTAEFDVTCGIRLLQKVFHDEYKRLSCPCQAQIHAFRELRNSLSHNYPLVLHEPQPHNVKLSSLLEKNEELGIVLNEIKQLEEKTVEPDVGEKLNDLIIEKKKEKYAIIEIEKLKVMLNDILEGVGEALGEDFTNCKVMIDKNLTDISRAKVQQYDQDTYDKEVERFKGDPIHKLITKAREELKQQYKNLRIANPCPWIVWDQVEKTSSLVNFYIDRIYTPLRIESPKTEISTEELLLASKEFRGKAIVPRAQVVSGLAGSGKTSLCLYLLHHWAEGTHDIQMLKDFNLVIFVEMRTVRSNTLESYLKTQRMKKSTCDIATDDLVQRLDELKLLFIIDGYDEAKKASHSIVEDIFAKFPDQRILVTTRGEFCDEVKKIATKYNVPYLPMEICGFDGSRIEEFTMKVFTVINQSSHDIDTQRNSNDSNEFLEYVRDRGGVLEKLLELPLTLALMIFLWVDCHETLNRVTTCTCLYYELFCLYQKKLKKRLEDFCSDKAVENRAIERLLLYVGKIAWQLLINEETVLSEEDEKEIEDQCKNEGVPKKELMSAFLVYEPDENADDLKHEYSFLHKTQMEYLSAYFIADETEKKNVCDAIESFTFISGLHQLILFLVGHFAIRNIIEPNLKEIFKLFDKADIKPDDYNFWWKIYIESKNSRTLLGKICQEKFLKEKWKLTQDNVVSGLELLIVSPPIRNSKGIMKELIIEIENGTDPYAIKDLLSIMCSMKEKLKDRYNKRNPLLTELFFGRHCEAKCAKPSDELLRTLYPWGHLRNFAGSVGEQPKGHEVLNYCFKVKNLRVRVDTVGAEVCLANSMQRISRSVRHLRVILAVDPEKCDPSSLACLTNRDLKGDLELTLPNMNDENKNWIVEVVEKLSGEHGCSRLVLEKSTLSFCTVLFLMMMMRDILHSKITIESTNELTDEQEIELEKQQKRTHIDAVWK